MSNPRLDHRRAHQHVAGQHASGQHALEKESAHGLKALGSSRGRSTTKLHALVDAFRNPLRQLKTPGQHADITQVEALLCDGQAGTVVAERAYADGAYEPDALVQTIEAHGATFVIPPRWNRVVQRTFDRNPYAERHKIERFYGGIKQFGRIATRYDKASSNHQAMAHEAELMSLLIQVSTRPKEFILTLYSLFELPQCYRW